MRKTFWRLNAVGIVAAGSIVVTQLFAVQAAPQGSPRAQNAPSPHEVIVIGCLRTTAANAYALKDFRDNNTYQIVASSEVVAPSDSLAWHNGHELEVHGMLDGTAAPGVARLRATSIIYISRRCQTIG